MACVLRVAPLLREVCQLTLVARVLGVACVLGVVSLHREVYQLVLVVCAQSVASQLGGAWGNQRVKKW